ncbi:MAG: hypothetical protein U5R46_02180 [Gammaproteobacteria bacterium]|nr:hypothetical protein [Gammaproteobacteria bacterium]
MTLTARVRGGQRVQVAEEPVGLFMGNNPFIRCYIEMLFRDFHELSDNPGSENQGFR